MKKVVTVGGGTGTFVVLSGLKKKEAIHLTAIVSVADDGGSTGRLRDAYGHLPPGDVRQALVALSEDETHLRALFSHRFEKGDVAGHNFGNLYITALTEHLGSGKVALEETKKLLRVRGDVIPVSERPAVLCAVYDDGTCIEGQWSIEAERQVRGPIRRLYLKDMCVASHDAVRALGDASLVVLGPGDIYTSTLANFVTDGLSRALATSTAKFAYIMNLFSTPESGRMTMTDYLRTVHTYVGRLPDIVLVNTAVPSKEAIEHYAREGQHLIIDDLGPEVPTIRGDFLSPEFVVRSSVDVIDRSLIRHDSDKLAEVLVTLL